VASLEEGSRPLCEVLEAAGEFDEVVVAVGPEGDFTAGEYAALATAGFQPVRLGANVLRQKRPAAYILSVVDQCASKGSPPLRAEAT
jgi:16S rRNA (uracil1498-N3)-methyltransferase